MSRSGVLTVKAERADRLRRGSAPNTRTTGAGIDLGERHIVAESPGEYEVCRVGRNYFVLCRYWPRESPVANAYRAEQYAREWLGYGWIVEEYKSDAHKSGGDVFRLYSLADH